MHAVWFLSHLLAIAVEQILVIVIAFSKNNYLWSNPFSYFSAKQWNAQSDVFRTSFFADFNTKIHCVTFM